MLHRTPRAWLLALVACAPAAAEIRSLTILHTNDLHARLLPLENRQGGFAYLASVIRRERSGCTDCILVNAGDVAQGSPVSTIFRGLPVFEIINLFGYDAATLGNHDFDYGWRQTRKFIETAKYPIVSANVADAAGALLTGKPYVILRVNGLRVAVIGIMTGNLNTLTVPKQLEQWHTLPPVATARGYAAEVRNQSDLVVVVGHISTREENQFLDTSPEIPVIVSGHAHSGMPQAINRNGRVGVRVKGYGAELGRLELKVDTASKSVASWNWKRIPVDSTKVEPAADVAREVQRWEAEVSARVDKPLGTAKRKIEIPEVRRLIEQAMREETGSDFAFMNSGGVRDVLPAGQLLERNLWDIMPFDNLVLVGTFKGRDLPPAVLGNRQVEPGRDYTLAVTDFTATNQSSAENLRSKGLRFPKDHGLLRDLLIRWVRNKKVIE